mmetsp:Transcript_6787/g.14774  ORF Transcript_6787/g.14774 Transcript_6787/m.14774 type:complete len:359 (+) Transcript_6787:152-1228(+)
MWLVALVFSIVAVAIGGVSCAKQEGVASMATSRSSSPITTAATFTKNELQEHNHVWRVMNKACFGKWSGTIQGFRMDKKTNSPIFKDNDELLNFRLWAKANTNWMGKKKDTGTWTVWNLQQKGDELIVPLRRLPLSKPSQLKIGFHPGCVLRIPSNFKRVPRSVFELGYWGEGVRRTVVLEYLTSDKNKHMELKDVTLVTQRAVPWHNAALFVGNATVSKDIDILPQMAPFDAKDVIQKNKQWKPLLVERLELQNMERVVTTKNKMTTDDKERAMHILKRLVQNSDDCNDSYNMVLSNGLLTSFPKHMSGKENGDGTTTTKSFIFAHKWGHGRPFQALVIDYDSMTGEGIAAVMYSYK